MEENHSNLRVGTEVSHFILNRIADNATFFPRMTWLISDIIPLEEVKQGHTHSYMYEVVDNFFLKQEFDTVNKKHRTLALYETSIHLN